MTTTPPHSSAPTTTSRPVGLSRCQGSQLAVSEGSGGAGLGHSAEVILLRNTSATACTLRGYPGVAGLDPAGHQLLQAIRTRSGYLGGLSGPDAAPPVVTVAPGRTVSAMVEGTDVPVGTATSCPELSGLLVTPPNTYTSVRLPSAPGDCSTLQVHPVVTGDTGTDRS